ncbi:MAG: translocation/assembly module TamB domain-containing protein [Endomicrobium sp.]|nr:translocation/assembly module TamB domain-containing protein [Endomicrobium sp.]
MRKIIIFFIILVLPISVYCARELLLVPYLQKYISVKTGHNISIGNFSLSPFKLSLKDVDADGVIKVQKIAFKLNLFKFLFNFFSPIGSIRQIEISNIEIDLKENQDVSALKPSEKKSVLKLPERGIDVYINEVLIKQGKAFFNISDAYVYVDTNTIKLDSVLHVAGHSVKLEALLKQKEGYLFDGTATIKSKNKINMLINSKGVIDLLSFNSDWNISIVKLNYKGFDFGGTLGTLLKNEKSADIEFVGKFGKFKADGLLSNTINAEAFIDLSQTSKSISGRLSMSFKKQKDLKELNLKASKLNAFNFNIGSFELLSSKNNNDTYKVVCDYGLKRRLEAIYLQGGNYEGDLIIRDKKAGYVKGNIRRGTITVDAKNINVTDMPLIPVVVESADGRVNISGNINEASGKIEFSFISNMNMTDAKGTVIRDKDKYTFDFYKCDDSVLLKHVVSGGNVISTDFKFKEVNILNVLRVIGHSEIDISGLAGGNISYEKDVGIKLDLRACDGTFYGNDFKEFEVKGEADLNKVEIERFVIKNASNTTIADIKGLIGFTHENPDSSMYINLKDIIVGGVKADCHSEFHGYLSDGKVVKGVLKSVETKISDISLGSMEADVNISTKNFDLLNLKSDNGLNATLSANLKRNEITGIIDFKNTNIEGVYPGIDGFLDASVRFSGKLNNPYIEISSLLKKGTYLSQPFSLSSVIFYKDGIVNISKTNIISGKAKLSLKGVYSSVGRLQVSVNNLNENIINILAGFTLPFKGEFFGEGEIRFRDKKPELKILLETKDAYVSSFKLKDLKAEIEIINKNIAIKSASAKISNSEIRVDKGFCDLNNNKYFLDLFLLNIHAGPSYLFGNVKLSGDIVEKNGISILNGIVDLNNLWVNKYKLNHYLFNYSFKEDRLKLFQKPSDKNNDFDLSGEIIFGDTLSVKKLNVVRKLSYFDMSGNFSKDCINLEVAGFSIDWKFMSNLFDLPAGLEGDADIHIKLKGDVSSLDGNMSITSTNGTLMNAPFDKLGVYMDFYNSCAYIKEAFVSKRNGIKIAVKGSFPISLSEKTPKESVDISYEIEDNKLSILKYLSNSFLNPLNGKLLLKGTINGSYKNLKSNGIFSVSDGIFHSNEYLDKIKNVSVEMSLTDNLIKLNKFTFNSGAGKVNIAGQIKLNNFIIKDFDIRAVTEGKKGIPISVPQLPVSKFMTSKSVLKDYSSGTSLFDIKITGTPQKPLISGYIVLEDTRFTFPGEKDNEDSNFSLPASTEFDLDLRTGINTKFENSFVSSLISGTLHINGSLNSLKSKGIIELTSGRLDYYGIEFDIVSAKLEIIDDNQIYVTAEGKNIVPSKTGGEFETIKLFVKRCKLSEFSKSNAIRFSSRDDQDMEPQKTFAKIMGMDQDKEINSSVVEFDPDKLKQVKQIVLRYFNQKFSTPLARSLFRKVGIADNFRISYVNTNNNVSTDENQGLVNLFSGTKYIVEKNINKDILFGYNLTFDEFNRRFDLRHGIELQYRLAPNLFLKGSYEFNAEEGSREDKSIILQRQLKF